MASFLTCREPIIFFWKTSCAPPPRSRVTTTISLFGKRESSCFHVVTAPEKIFCNSSVESDSFILSMGFLGLTETVRASIPSLYSLKFLIFAFSVSFTSRASIPKLLVPSKTDFTPAPEPPLETKMMMFLSGNTGLTLFHVSYFSI